jgi:hypothetical protein
VFGLVVALVDLTGWRGQTYAPWGSTLAIFGNLTYMGGMVAGGALLFFLAAVACRLFTRQP